MRVLVVALVSLSLFGIQPAHAKWFACDHVTQIYSEDLALAKNIFLAFRGPSAPPAMIYSMPSERSYAWKRAKRDHGDEGWFALVRVLKRIGWRPPRGSEEKLARALFLAHRGPPLYPSTFYDDPRDAWCLLYARADYARDRAWERLIPALRETGWGRP